MTISSAIEPEAAIKGVILNNEPLADYTTWRVGGVASILFKPDSIADLAIFLQNLPESEPLWWLGLGSNTLIRDGGFPGTVILTQGSLRGLQILDEPHLVRAESGVSCAQMARFCARNNLSGGEFWAGIPGTVGGALRMNAGCFNSETWNWVKKIETIDRFGTVRERSVEDFHVQYRQVDGPKNEWFVAATFALNEGNKETSLALIKELLAHRAATQPTGEYNCGSVFRNPPGNFAAKLIESCHLKGFCIGGAMVSEKHANFIINHAGQATASDIEQLIHYVQAQVLKQTGINLHCEVHILGDAK